jgi:hypothetical protein
MSRMLAQRRTLVVELPPPASDNPKATDTNPQTAYVTRKTITLVPAANQRVVITRIAADVSLNVNALTATCDILTLDCRPSVTWRADLGYSVQGSGDAEGANVLLASRAFTITAPTPGLPCSVAGSTSDCDNDAFTPGDTDSPTPIAPLSFAYGQPATVRFKLKYAASVGGCQGTTQPSWTSAAACVRNATVYYRLVSRRQHGQLR